MTAIQIGLALLATVALVIMFRFFVSLFGCSCGRCGRRMTIFTRLAVQDQHEIVSHFRQHERRTPDTTAMFACRSCRIVYDDFSGEKLSMSGDDKSICKVCGQPFVTHIGHLYANGEINGFVSHNTDLVEVIECLHCERRTKTCAICDSSSKVTGCRRCHTLYRWQTDGQWQFLHPLTEQKLLSSAVDPTGGLV